MNKGELIDHIASAAGISRAQANAAMDAFTDGVTSALSSGDRVTLVGFGTFSVSERAARTGRNPQTGAALKIKARKVPKFKAGKEFAEGISGGKKKGATKGAAAPKAAAPAKGAAAGKAAATKAAPAPAKAAAAKKAAAPAKEAAPAKKAAAPAKKTATKK